MLIFLMFDSVLSFSPIGSCLSFSISIILRGLQQDSIIVASTTAPLDPFTLRFFSSSCLLTSFKSTLSNFFSASLFLNLHIVVSSGIPVFTLKLQNIRKSILTCRASSSSGSLKPCHCYSNIAFTILITSYGFCPKLLLPFVFL